MSQNSPELQIAIDGPVAAGKGDIASRLAKELGMMYIYTGALYRALALACIEHSVDLKNPNAVLSVLEKSDIQLIEPGIESAKAFGIQLNGTDVTERIFFQDVAFATSDIGTLPEVRSIMVKRQQQLADGKRVVMEGRDIGLKVLPHAQLKIFLTASPEERAKRRQLQWQEQGLKKTYEETLADTVKRDMQDSTRSIDPLQKLHDAWELDTTGKSQDEVIDEIKKELRNRGLI